MIKITGGDKLTSIINHQSIIQSFNQTSIIGRFRRSRNPSSRTHHTLEPPKSDLSELIHLEKNQKKQIANKQKYQTKRN